MVKHLHKVLEEHRTAVRKFRRDGQRRHQKAMKDKKITEDDEKRSLDESKSSPTMKSKDGRDEQGQRKRSARALSSVDASGFSRVSRKPGG